MVYSPSSSGRGRHSRSRQVPEPPDWVPQIPHKRIYGSTKQSIPLHLKAITDVNYMDHMNPKNAPFRLTREFIQQDRNAVYRTTALEMRLDLLGRSTVIHISDKNTSRIDLLLVLCQVFRLLIQGGLHLAQFGGFGFHLCYSCFHRGDFFLLGGYLSVTVRIYVSPKNSKGHEESKR